MKHELDFEVDSRTLATDFIDTITAANLRAKLAFCNKHGVDFLVRDACIILLDYMGEPHGMFGESE